MKRPEQFMEEARMEYLITHDSALVTVAPQDIERIYAARKKAGLLPVEMYDIPQVITVRELAAALDEISKVSFGCAKLDIATLMLVKSMKDLINPLGTVRPCGCGKKLSDPTN